jgi:hypothetical protein
MPVKRLFTLRFTASFTVRFTSSMKRTHSNHNSCTDLSNAKIRGQTTY